jgi:hypothetical protein
MVKLGGFVPEVGQEVLIVNHIGSSRISRVDAETRSVNVTILRNGGALDGIPWDELMLLDKAREIFDKGPLTDPQSSKEVQELFDKALLPDSRTSKEARELLIRLAAQFRGERGDAPKE